MKTLICSLLLVASAACSAEVIASAATKDTSAQMLFTDQKGACQGDARRSEYRKPDAETILGCWVVRAQGYIAVTWFDGSFDRVPLSQLKHDAL